MPAPTNTSFLTATDLGTITTTDLITTQQADDAGTTYDLYFSFIAPRDGMVGVLGFGDLTTYFVRTTPYVGPAAAPTQVKSITNINKGIQFFVTSGSLYLLKCAPTTVNPAPANLTLHVILAPVAAIPAGSIAINDDTDGFPLAILSGTADYTTLRYIDPFPAGEAADTLVTGTAIVEDIANTGYKVFNSSYQEIASHTTLGQLRIRTCLGANKFYVGVNTNPSKFYTVLGDGTLGGPEVLTAMTSMGACAASNDELTLYHAFTGTNQAIRQWTIGTGAAANLAAGIANYIVSDILVLSDNSILVGYYKNTVTRDFKVLRYSAAGATLNTYGGGGAAPFPTPAATTTPRLAYAIDDPVSFWAWTHPASTVGISDILNIKVSDGSILTTRHQMEFETGIYGGTSTATPPGFLGMSFSCPFWITRAAQPTTQTFTIRRQRRWLLPSSDDNHQMQIPVIEILGRGNGLTPGPSGSPVQGEDPILMWRLSKDGGKTWLSERPIPAGLQGQYQARWRILQATGNYRNAVGEITVTDPVDWQMIAAMAPNGIVEGSS